MMSKILLGIIAAVELAIGIALPIRLIGDEETNWRGWRTIPFLFVSVLHIFFYMINRMDMYFNPVVWLTVDLAFAALHLCAKGKHRFMLGTLSILMVHMLVALDFAVGFALISYQPMENNSMFSYSVEMILYDTPVEIIWIGFALRAIAMIFTMAVDIEGKLTDLKRNRSALVVLDGLSLLFCLFLQRQFALEQTELEINYLYIALFMVCVWGLGFVLYDVINSNRERRKSIEYRNQGLEKNYSYLYEEQRRLERTAHDFKNHVNLLISYLEEEQYVLALEYSKELRNPLSVITQRSWSGNKMLDTILNLKMAEAKRSEIPVQMKVDKVENLPVTDYDLCVILSNLLDNAIEASAFTEKKQIEVTISVRAEMILFRIVNRIGKRPKKRGEQYQSTKGQRGLHGLGLESVQAAVGKYRGQLNLTHDEEMFTALVMLYRNANEKSTLDRF